MATKKPVVGTAGRFEQIQSGDYVAPSALGSGTTDATTVLYGDGTWKTAPSGGGGGTTLSSVGISMDGGDEVISVGFKGFVTVGYSGVITSVMIVSEEVGSISIDVWKRNADIPTVAHTICAGDYVILASSQFANVSINDWADSVAVGDVFGFYVNSVSDITKCTVTITVET